MKAPWRKHPLLSEGHCFRNNSHILLDLLEVAPADLSLTICEQSYSKHGHMGLKKKETRKYWINESKIQERVSPSQIR